MNGQIIVKETHSKKTNRLFPTGEHPYSFCGTENHFVCFFIRADVFNHTCISRHTPHTRAKHTHTHTHKHVHGTQRHGACAYWGPSTFVFTQGLLLPSPADRGRVSGCCQWHRHRRGSPCYSSSGVPLSLHHIQLDWWIKYWQILTPLVPRLFFPCWPSAASGRLVA